MHPITILSFGYLHSWPQDAPTPDITVDLRRLLADPAHVPNGAMLDMNGLDESIREFVFATPGARALMFNVRRTVADMSAIKPIVVALGCAGGRHRSVVLAAELYVQLAVAGYEVSVKHLHVHLPRVIREGHA